MLSDGYGTIVELGEGVSDSSLVGGNGFLTPIRGWLSDPAGPENPSRWAITGSTCLYDLGMTQD